MTYMVNGRQFVLLWTSQQASGQPSELVAFAIPQPRAGRGGGAGAR
ncbi:MAG: hypothetical protein IPL75_01725 [Acidobacteria bacterium]|nr:hypothetical protein [Acidobacteriota bacterium]